MKKLEDILVRVKVTGVIGRKDIVVTGITFDSRSVAPGWVFVAIKGNRVDGHKFIGQAIEKGASVIVCKNIPTVLKEEITYVKTTNTAQSLGNMAAAFYNFPSENLKLVGITGTNGKTTTATILYNLFTSLGYKAGLFSTIQNKVAGKSLPATHTTPDSVQLQKVLRHMVERGCDYAFMEVSSHALDQGRIAGLEFAGAVFTNLTHDHLDYHSTFRNYLNAKKKLFDRLPADAFALVNIDDKNGSVMLQNTMARKRTFALKSPADFKAKILENHFSGMQINLNGTEVNTLLSGTFNAYNLLAAYSVAMLLGQQEEEVLTALSGIRGAEGRFDLVASKSNVTGIVDYAHTPDALSNILSSINSLRTKNENLITVVGAGGDRDREKRPKMAGIASAMSDLVILTSDNPRSEDPQAILDEMLKGIDAARKNKTLVISNREEAIKTAVNMARPGDIILVAGKGHEKYQEVKGVRKPFDDKKVLTQLLAIA